MLFANLWKVIILGIIEGIIEWFPISGTGHLTLVDEFVKLDLSKDFMEMFNVVIQLGAIMAVVILYFHKLNPPSPKKNSEGEKDTWILRSKVLVACLPAVAIGLKFDDYLDAYFYNFLTVSIMLVVYGTAFIVIERRNKNVTPKRINLKDFVYKAALIVGVFRILALIPGTSRSGATILRAILIEASRFIAIEFLLSLGIPIMLGASFLKIFKFLAKGNTFGLEEIITLLTGSIVAFVVSIIAIKFLLNYLEKNDFTVFGWYHVILSAILIGYWLFS